MNQNPQFDLGAKTFIPTSVEIRKKDKNISTDTPQKTSIARDRLRSNVEKLTWRTIQKAPPGPCSVPPPAPPYAANLGLSEAQPSQRTNQWPKNWKRVEEEGRLRVKRTHLGGVPIDRSIALNVSSSRAARDKPSPTRRETRRGREREIEREKGLLLEVIVGPKENRLRVFAWARPLGV